MNIYLVPAHPRRSDVGERLVSKEWYYSSGRVSLVKNNFGCQSGLTAFRRFCCSNERRL